MLVHGVPWQFAAGQMLVVSIAYGAALLVALLLGVFGWLPLFGGLLLVAAFVVLIGMIPLFMNMSRGFFLLLLAYLGGHILVTIFAYAFQYWHAGIAASDGTIVRSFRDSLYFSVTTWTTLGYGDFAPIPAMRLVTSVEALTGVITIAISAAFVWLWCTENLVPKEKAFFDGNRRHRKDISIHRMRIRTLTGHDKDLGDDWVDPPKPGESYTWSPEREEWIVVTEDMKLADGTEILEKESERRDPTTESNATSG